MESGVPNPQSGRVARAEDEAKGEENSGFHSALMTTGDLVGSLSGLSVQGGEEIQQEISQPGKLFIGGVSGTTTQEGFDNYFSQFGYLIDSVVMFDKETRNSRGFGFVTYADKADADRVMEIQAEEVAKAKEALKKRNGEPGDESQIKAGHVIDDKVVEIKRAEPRSPSGNNKWKGQQGGNHYNQLQQQQLRRQLGVVGGRGYPRSVPYRQLQQQPPVGQGFNPYQAQTGFMPPDQMYIQHYPPQGYGYGYGYGASAPDAAGYHESAAAAMHHHYVPHHHHQQYPGGYVGYSGMDGQVYYNLLPPPRGHSVQGGKGDSLFPSSKSSSPKRAEISGGAEEGLEDGKKNQGLNGRRRRRWSRQDR